MILSRVLSLGLRFAEFVCSVVVLGLMAHFIHEKGAPRDREIYTLVIASLSALLSLVWMFPTVSHMLHVPADILLSLAWFAAFGLLVNWLGKIKCGSAFSWGNINVHHNSACSEWQASEAFSFLAAIFFAASALLGLWVYHRGEPRRRTVRSRV